MNLLEVSRDPSALSLRDRETWNYCKNVLGLSPTTFSVNEDGSVSVRQEGTPLRIAQPSLEVDFHYVGGDFMFVHHATRSLRGSPKHVDGTFHCNSTEITSLVGGPELVDGDYICRNTKITSLEGVAKDITGELDFVKCPYITSLKGIEKQVVSLRGDLEISSSVKSHILGVFLIKEFAGEVIFEFDIVQGKCTELAKIINTHRKEGDVHGCQQALIDAGYANYARL